MARTRMMSVSARPGTVKVLLAFEVVRFRRRPFRARHSGSERSDRVPCKTPHSCGVLPEPGERLGAELDLGPSGKSMVFNPAYAKEATPSPCVQLYSMSGAGLKGSISRRLPRRLVGRWKITGISSGFPTW